jgi:hypothetical protein
MWTLPYSTPQKAGVILYGLLIGALMVPLTAGAVLLLGMVLLFVHAASRHGGAFFLAQLLFYGFYLGIPVGVFVCWRVCRSRLREAKPENLS